MQRANDYDAMARAYVEENQNNAFNALYERPAMLSMVGDVAGLNILDAGCGGGTLAQKLVSQGASVSGVDLSKNLLAIAREKLGSKVELIESDLQTPLPFADKQFDLVVSSLVMHYMEDWANPLGEIYRVLKDGGRFVFSTHHPFMDYVFSGADNYFSKYEYCDTWIRAGKKVKMKFWHRPLVQMIKAFEKANFKIEKIDEPMPAQESKQHFFEEWHMLTTQPQFLFFSLCKG